MVKKLFVILCMLALLGFSFTLLRKTKSANRTIVEEDVVAEVEPSFPDTQFTFTRDTLEDKCETESAMLCSLEKAVKCTLNPDFANCRKEDLPKFIFMSEPGLDRPTEISYKIVEQKTLSNDTIEIHTESSCNGTWFGLCQGNIIYVMAPKPENDWYVKDIYAIE